jgi:hypothetical protein
MPRAVQFVERRFELSLAHQPLDFASHRFTGKRIPILPHRLVEYGFDGLDVRHDFRTPLSRFIKIDHWGKRWRKFEARRQKKILRLLVVRLQFEHASPTAGGGLRVAIPIRFQTRFQKRLDVVCKHRDTPIQPRTKANSGRELFHVG